MFKQCKNLTIIGLNICAALILSINVCFAQQNPFITSMFLADPSAHVWNDGRLYFYFPHPSETAWNKTWKIGVATSTSPDSGFKCQGYIPGLESLIDPQPFQ